MINHIHNLFVEKFNREADKFYFSPGRVNIIGEHTDYNGGHVLPFCIDKGIFCGVNRNKNQVINIFSENYPLNGTIKIDLENLTFKKHDIYSDYLLGAIKELKKANCLIDHGFNICLSSNLPNGGGLSSSAALSLLFLVIFNDEFRFNLTKLEMVKMAKAIENDFIGVNCGIMDQFVIMFGGKNYALFLNTKNLVYENVYLDMKDHQFVLINSDIKRNLIESNYNKRQSETQEVLKILQKHFAIDYLCDIKAEDLDDHLAFVSDLTLKKRLVHVVTENHRVKQAKFAILENNYDKLGKLLSEAHLSAKDNYEVSSLVLDEMVELALQANALGAKMIGGGFGGSILVLIKKEELENFIEIYGNLFYKKYSKKFIYSLISAKDGIKQID